jgi:hypothetical protein
MTDPENYGAKAKQARRAHLQNLPYLENVGNEMAIAIANLPQCNCDTNFCKDCIQNQKHNALLKMWEELTGFIPEKAEDEAKLKKDIFLKMPKLSSPILPNLSFPSKF